MVSSASLAKHVFWGVEQNSPFEQRFAYASHVLISLVFEEKVKPIKPTCLAGVGEGRHLRAVKWNSQQTRLIIRQLRGREIMWSSFSTNWESLCIKIEITGGKFRLLSKEIRAPHRSLSEAWRSVADKTDALRDVKTTPENNLAVPLFSKHDLWPAPSVAWDMPLAWYQSHTLAADEWEMVLRLCIGYKQKCHCPKHVCKSAARRCEADKWAAWFVHLPVKAFHVSCLTFSTAKDILWQRRKIRTFFST